MKIALALYPINDLGGIINHVENLAFGLRELGHSVDLCILYWQDSFSRVLSSSEIRKKNGWYNGAFCAVNQQIGWNAIPGVHKFSYKTKENLEKLKDHLSTFDLIIWEVPVPTKIKVHYNNSKWLQFYDCCPKNIAVIHDGNIKNIPWIYEVKDKFKGIACVHECAFNSAKILDIPRSMILNPQDLSGLEEIYNYKERERGFLSLQVFKAWKHVDDLIRAIPYMSSYLRKIIAGGGIEQRYMVSETKAKSRYYCSSDYDSDFSEILDNRKIKIWDRALAFGMEYLGFISPFSRDIILRKVRTLVDPSYSLRYAKNGSHFNRVVVDAMRMGTIPIGINYGMSDNEEGDGPVFKPDQNYIMIPYDVSPKEYAELIEYANNLFVGDAYEIVKNNYELLQEFDRGKIAQDFINLSNGKKCGFWNKRVQGKEDKEIKIKSEEEMKFFISEKSVFITEKKNPEKIRKFSTTFSSPLFHKSSKIKKSKFPIIKIKEEKTVIPIQFKDLIIGMSKHGKIFNKKSVTNIILKGEKNPFCGITHMSNPERAEVWLNKSVLNSGKIFSPSKDLASMCRVRENTVTILLSPNEIDKALKIIEEFKEWKKEN